MNIDQQLSNIESNLSDQSDKWEILFLDTFTSSAANLDVDLSNEDANKKEPNIGLVQFSCPVVIHEVRIIPLSTVVTAESLRTVRLGATIPSSFDLNFYVNDLKAKESSTFLDIGCFSFREYENNVFKPSVLVATDGLFLRGHFESVTLAVLGAVTDLSTLLNKEPTSKLSNDVNDNADEDIEESSSHLNYERVEIKEPDDTQDFLQSVKIESNNDTLVTANKSEHLVQDVHSLSPSPEPPLPSTRILSPSPHYSLSTTPKSHSNSSRENQKLKKIKDYDYDQKKYSRSRSSSISPNPTNNYASKSRIRYPPSPTSLHKDYHSPPKIRTTSIERERDDINSSSHHHYHRGDRYSDYGDRKNYPQQYHRSNRRSRERSVEIVSRSLRSKDHHSGKYSNDCRSRSRSRESDESRDRHHYRANHGSMRSTISLRHEDDRHKRQRSISLEEKNHDNRSSIHSRDSRDDNRSVSSLRTRNSGGHYDYSDNSRDLSPQSSKYNQKHQHRIYHSSSSSILRSGRRSRSLSPNSRKRDYHDDDQHYSHHNSKYTNRSSHSTRCDSIDKSSIDAVRSPDIKKARYNISSPVSVSITSPGSIHFNNNDDNDKNEPYVRNIDSVVGNKRESSKEIESIASPVSPTDDDDDDETMVVQSQDPLSNMANISPHSSISNESLDKFLVDSDIQKDPPTIKEEELSNDSSALPHNEQQDETKITTEFFEPLSPLDNDELLKENGDDCENDDNFEQISTSSDEPNIGKNERAELEVISSDEEYDDELNAALASENVEYAKSYLAGEKFDDDEIDGAFDLQKNLFNPFAHDQLSPVKFPFNRNKTTTFIDMKLFSSIIVFVRENFANIYEENVASRKNLIRENWVQNVEQLASKIMQLTCPIYYSFNEDENQIDLREEIENLIPKLISIVKDGLDYELALKQEKAPFKVRHLKAGIKLLIALFSSFDIRFQNEDDKLFQGLFDQDLPYDLLKLYNKPYMSLPLKLLILNGLIVICDHPEGVEYLCNKYFDWSSTITIQNPDENDKTPIIANPVVLSEDLLRNSTCYQYILSLCLAPQIVRLTWVFEELLEKIHLYELFQALCNTKQNGADNNQETSDLHAILSQIIVSFERLSNRIHRPLRLLPNICQYEIKTAVHTSIPLLLLSTTESILDNVPNQSQFEYIHERFNCKHTSCSSSKVGFFSQKAFYRFFEHFNVLGYLIDFLESLSNSMKMETLIDDQNRQKNIYFCEIIIKLLDCIVSHQQGLKFLLEDQKNVNQVNTIHYILSEFSTDNTVDQRQRRLVKKVVNFGAKFITRLYTFGLIDNILHNIYTFQKDNQSNRSSAELIVPSRNTSVIDSLLRLFMMVHFEKAIFRDWVIAILTMEHNFDAIYSFIVPITSQFETKNHLMNNEKISSLDSTSFIYATRLSMACVQYMPEKNLLHFYETYGKSLLKNTENVQIFVQNSTVKLHRSDIFQSHILKYSTLIDWILPLKNDNFNSNDELIIRKFVTILKKHHDSFQNMFATIENYVDRVFFIEPELITAIKILISLCDPLADYGKNQDPNIQLKYQYSLICCYHFDCISYLLTLLEAVVETCERPSHRTFPYTFNDSYINLFVRNLKINPNAASSSSSNVPPKAHSLQQLNNSILHQGTLIIEFLRPSVRFLNLILKYLSKSTGDSFGDSTPIPILLKLYHMLNHFHSSSNSRLYPDIELSTKSYAESIQKQIIDIILSVYTAVYDDGSNTEESWKKSIWTKMLKQVLEFTQQSPKYFVSGLEILSQILPILLPLVVSKPLVGTEALFIINYRKTWSAHLHCVNESFESMITCLVLSNCTKVQTLLRVVCHKMCDLHSATVLTVSKTITEFLVHNLANVIESKLNLNEQQQQQNSKLETQSTSLIDPKYHCNSCVKIIDFVLDLFASSLSFRIGILNALYCFATSGPANKESKIYKFFKKMFDYLIEKKFDPNFNVLSTHFLAEIFSGKAIESKSDGRNLLELFEQYFDVNDANLILTLKTFKFSDKLTSKFVLACSQSLNQYFDDRKIFIYDNEEMENEENTLSEQNPEANSPNSPGQDDDDSTSIGSAQFVQLSSKFKMPDVWNSLNVERDLNQYDLTKIDLVKFAQKYLKIDPETLIKDLTNYYSPIVERPETPEKQEEDVVKLKNINLPPKRTPLRGRGRLYGHRGDPFRSRPPNTSRPPSMHVDDFVALEQRSDPLAGLVNKNRSNHLLHVNTSVMMPSHSSTSGSISSYAGKHSEYIRKKNYSTHHPLHGGHAHVSSSSPYHSNYSNQIKTSSNNMLNNQPK